MFLLLAKGKVPSQANHNPKVWQVDLAPVRHVWSVLPEIRELLVFLDNTITPGQPGPPGQWLPTLRAS